MDRGTIQDIINELGRWVQDILRFNISAPESRIPEFSRNAEFQGVTLWLKGQRRHIKLAQTLPRNFKKLNNELEKHRKLILAVLGDSKKTVDVIYQHEELVIACKQELIDALASLKQYLPVFNLDTAASEITYKGATYSLTAPQLRFLSKLNENPGSWVQGAEIRKYATERLNQVKNSLPMPIRKLIESSTSQHKGYRLKLE